MMAIARRLRAAVADAALANCLRKRTLRTSNAVIRRKSNGTLWVPGSPQNIGYAMRGLFDRRHHFHFYRVRLWRGIMIASPKVFWKPASGDFELLAKGSFFVLPKWPVHIECAKIDEMAA